MRGVSKPYEETHKIMDGIEYKLCSDCNKWHPMTKEYFYKNKCSPDGFYPYCKGCTKKRSSKWQNENIEKKRASDVKHNTKPERKQGMRVASKKYRETGGYIAWQHNNKDKLQSYASKRNLHKKHDITNEEWENCKNYFNYRCAYCDLPIEEHWFMYAGKIINGDFSKEHVDHMGKNDLSNCVPSCKTCNSEKNESSLEDWYYINNPNYTKERLDRIHKWLESDYKLFQEVK